MSNYKIYHMPYNKPIKQICILAVEEEKLTHEQLEEKIDKFIKNNYKELVYECVELVLVDTETKDAEYRFNYVIDLDCDDENLHPYLDWLESDFLYHFVEAYENTYDKEFEGNANRINRA